MATGPAVGGVATGIPQSALDNLTRSLHFTPEQIAALSQAGQSTQKTLWEPFALPEGQNLETGVLWRGYKAGEFNVHPGLPKTRPTNMADFNVKFGKHNIRIVAPNFGPEYHTVVRSTIGDNPSDADIQNAREQPGKQLRIWVEIRDQADRAIFAKDIDEEGISTLYGETAAQTQARTGKAPKGTKPVTTHPAARKPGHLGTSIDQGTYEKWGGIPKEPAPEPEPRGRTAEGDFKTEGYYRNRPVTGEMPIGEPGQTSVDEHGRPSIREYVPGQTLSAYDVSRQRRPHVRTAAEQAARGKKPGELTVTIDPYAEDQGTVEGVPKADDTTTLEEEMQTLYNLPQAQMWNYKTQLWLAGYYPSGTKLDEVNQNTISNDDIAAFSGVMMAATRYWNNGKGKRVTWQDLLAQQAADPSAKKRAAAAKGTVTYRLTDAAEITKDANETAIQVLGRKPSNEDVSALINLIHSHEKKQQAITGWSGGEPGSQPSGTTEDVNPAADVEDYLRKQYPNEAMAVDWGSAAQVWNQMLASTSPQPRIVGLSNP